MQLIRVGARGKWRRTALAFAFVTFVYAPHGVFAATGVKPEPSAVFRGTALYKKYCVSCHRKDGVGEPRVPWSIRRPDLIEAMPLNETSHAWHHGDEQLVATIMEGTERSRRRMPAFGSIITLQDATDLVAYLKSLWSERILACQGPAHMRCM